MASDIRIAGCTCDMVVSPYGTGQIVEVSYSNPKPIAAEGYEIVSYEPERCQAITENTVSTVTEDGTELYRYETGPSHVITEDTSGDVEYSGETNTQYESAEGYVRSLTVQGQSMKWNQLLANGNFASSDGWTASSATMSVSSGVCSISANTGTWGGAMHNCYPSVSGHKYLVMLRAKSDTSNRINVATGYGNNTTIGTVGSSWTDIAGILTASRVNTSINIANRNSTDAFSFTNVTLFDLTAIFGAGNEPATVDAFKATDVYKAKLAAGELYYYDAGSLVSIEGVGVVGRNLSPFFAHSFTDTAYWDNLATTRITQGEDGWAHIVLDNTGASGTMFANWFTKAAAKPLGFKPSTVYTFVIEVRNGTYNQTCYIAPDSYYAAQLSMFASTGSFTLSADGTYYRTVTSRDDLSVASLFNRGYFAVNPNGKFEADVRISIYEGDYTGAFEPYITPTTITTQLRSAGSVHDTLTADADSWTVERRVGVVDLGSLTWTYTSGDHSRFVGALSDFKHPVNDSTLSNCICAAFTTDTLAHIYLHTTDKTIGLHQTANNIWVYDSTAGTDPDAFKTAMSGVYLFYELAEPTTDPETSMDTIEIGSAFTVATDFDSTFEMTVVNSMMDVTSYFGYNCFTGPILAQVTYGSTASFVLETYIDFNSIVVRDSERTEYTLSDISCTVQDTVEYVQHPETGGWGSEQQKNLYIPWQDIR